MICGVLLISFVISNVYIFFDPKCITPAIMLMTGICVSISNAIGSSNCDFSSSNFSEAKLQSSYQTNNQFIQANFDKALFDSSHFQGCDFTNANFSNLQIQGSSLSKVILNGVQWNKTKCFKSGFDKLTISGNINTCSFESCEFRKVTFENATLT